MRPSRLALWLVVWVLSMVVTLFAGAMAYKYRDKIRSLVQSAQASQIIETNLYLLRMQEVPVPGEGRDGGIAALADGVLLVSRNGKAWFVDGNKRLKPLALHVPVNTADFESDPFNKDTVERERFGVKDILVRSNNSGVEVFASYTEWNSEKDCYGLRVSSLDATTAQLMSGGEDINYRWKTVFDTLPCRTLNMLKSGKRAVTLGAGGRLALLSDSEILFSVGGFGAESEAVESENQAAAGGESSYGKTVLINLATKSSRNFSRGHRNPQGLATGSDSRVWLTEHGPKGGDELNRILDGLDYGWPHVTYGTEYEMMVWPENPHQGRHEGYEKPAYAWVPSIGVSQLMIVEKEAFPYWKGDLLVTSLKAMTVFRVRIEDGRTIFSEPIPIGHRIRDIVETESGSIVLKTDDNFLVYLEPVSAVADGQPGASAERGQVLAAQCKGCHSIAEDGSNGIGPNLRGVVGRRIAGLEGFNYSEGLKAVRMKAKKGRWTPEAMQSFLKDPEAFAPGNAMQMSTRYSDKEIADLIAYFETVD